MLFLEHFGKYFPLQDDKGIFLAGPQHDNRNGGTFEGKIKGGESMTIWVKFPAPPKGTTTVDLFVPGMLPFEDLQVSQDAAKG